MKIYKKEPGKPYELPTNRKPKFPEFMLHRFNWVLACTDLGDGVFVYITKGEPVQRIQGKIFCICGTPKQIKNTIHKSSHYIAKFKCSANLAINISKEALIELMTAHKMNDKKAAKKTLEIIEAVNRLKGI